MAEIIATSQTACQEGTSYPPFGGCAPPNLLPKLPMDGKSIRDARRRIGMTQDELGRIAGVSGGQISRFEAGTRRPRFDEAKKIAEALGLDLSVADADNVLSWLSPKPPHPAAEGHKRNVRSTIPLPEGMAAFEHPAPLSPGSRKILKAWLELLLQLADK